MKSPRRLASRLAITIASMLLLLGAAVAPAGADVVNGDFEAGSLAGWQQASTSQSAGGWFITGGGKAPVSGNEGSDLDNEIAALEQQVVELEEGLEGAVTVEEQEELEAELEEALEELEEAKQAKALGLGTLLPPAGGSFYAASDENNPSSAVLYQDVALSTETKQTLSLDLYFRSFAPLVHPSPNTLDYKPGGPNQQVRVDVMKAGTSPTSLAPEDILTTVYATGETALPTGIPWTHLTADLSPFAGQTVRLRFAAVDNAYFLNAGVDNVSIETPSNAFTFGKLKKNAKKGSATLTVTVPGPGVLKLASAGGKKAKASAARRQGSKQPKRPKKPVKAAKKNVAAAGSVKLAVKPTSAALEYLKAKGSLSAKLAVTFTPTGGSANTVTKTVVLKLTKPKRK